MCGTQHNAARAIFGGLGRNRTTDTRIFSPLLYRLSYQAGNHCGKPSIIATSVDNSNSTFVPYITCAYFRVTSRVTSRITSCWGCWFQRRVAPYARGCTRRCRGLLAPWWRWRSAILAVHSSRRRRWAASVDSSSSPSRSASISRLRWRRKYSAMRGCCLPPHLVR